jgi:hypothetical protein
MRNQQIQNSIIDLEQQAARLEQRNIEIAKINAQLESEAFLEQEARLRLGLVKEGERVVVISEDSGKMVDIGGATIMEKTSEIFPTSTVSRWLAYFFDTELFHRIELSERPEL